MVYRTPSHNLCLVWTHTHTHCLGGHCCVRSELRSYLVLPHTAQTLIFISLGLSILYKMSSHHYLGPTTHNPPQTGSDCGHAEPWNSESRGAGLVIPGPWNIDSPIQSLPLMRKPTTPQDQTKTSLDLPLRKYSGELTCVATYITRRLASVWVQVLNVLVWCHHGHTSPMECGSQRQCSPLVCGSFTGGGFPLQEQPSESQPTSEETRPYIPQGLLRPSLLERKPGLTGPERGEEGGKLGCSCNGLSVVR